MIENLLNRPRAFSQIGDKLHKGAGVLPLAGTDELHLGLLTHWHPHDIVLGGLEPKLELVGELSDLSNLSNIERMMVLDTVTYLPDDLLVKVDRAAMSVSLESRMPFLDHRVVEFA